MSSAQIQKSITPIVAIVKVSTSVMIGSSPDLGGKDLAGASSVVVRDPLAAVPGLVRMVILPKWVNVDQLCRA